MSGFEVDLVEHTPGAPHSGIGRYTLDLLDHLPARVAPRLTTHRDPPLTRSVSFLHHLPVGVHERRPGSIVHFVEDLGCSQMLWRPVHPAIATSHDLGMLVWPPEAAMHRTLDRQIWKLSYLGLRRMDALIAPSEFSRQMLMRHVGIAAERVFTIHSGVDAGTFRPRPDGRAQMLERYRLPAAPDDRYLLYVGTEIPRKNLATLMRALARLPVGVRLLKVGAAGHPRFRRATERIIRELALEDRVIFVGEVTDGDLALLYTGADCYVCCSFLEGFGQPVLEAMACGAPVVCSDVSSLPEITADAAMLVPPADVSRLAEAIRSVLDDPALGATLRARGLQRSRDFSWQKTADAVVDVYERLIEGRVP